MKKYLWWFVGLVVVAGAAWFFFFRSPDDVKLLAAYKKALEEYLKSSGFTGDVSADLKKWTETSPYKDQVLAAMKGGKNELPDNHTANVLPNAKKYAGI